ncbi:MAG: hypothetical protein LC785_01795 [Acidobacteria bacterium]|nr:hypothetical protein [Acidobacteriota bacterium]MCA1640718.1 hypothetical protein [Acidobacteriota bacterium]
MARQNAFARRLLDEQRARHTNNRKKVVIEREVQPTIDEQLVRLEEDIRKLKIEFDIFFNGASKRPPYDTKSRVESLVKRLGDERHFTYSQRYRYNTLVARYVALRDLWRRNVQDREEGRDPVAAARAQLGKGRVVNERERRASFVCADARADEATVRGLYDALVEAKKSCGEPVEDFSLAKFQKMIASKTDALKERLGCERVRYTVYTEGGRVSFKAKADE